MNWQGAALVKDNIPESELTLKNIVWCSQFEKRAEREIKQGHSGQIVWLTGLSGSGKTTVANGVEENLGKIGFQSVVLDGDNLRHGLCNDLSFTLADRNENVRRIGEVARLFLEQGFVVLVALVSPVRDARDQVRRSFSEADFIEVYCKCTLEICRERDPKGLYAKAESGKIAVFAGVNLPYEEPLNPELVLLTSEESEAESVARLTQLIINKVKGRQA